MKPDMLDIPNFKAEAELRRDAWFENSLNGRREETEADPDYWDYRTEILNLLVQNLESIETMVGEEFAAEPFRQLIIEGAGGNISPSGSWKELLEQAWLADTRWPIVETFSSAALYGIYGVIPSDIPKSERTSWVNRLVKDVASFVQLADLPGRPLTNPMSRIASIAQSRHALDNGQGEVDLTSLSILGGVSEGRLRNLMSGEAAVLERGPNGGIVATSALAWLLKRKDYMQSIWMYDDTPSNSAETDNRETKVIAPDRVLFVPVAKDGSIFHPDLKRSGKYQIGAKGEEQHFEKFEEALAALNIMTTPRWRRPNASGQWGIVSGVAWQRIERNPTEH